MGFYHRAHRAIAFSAKSLEWIHGLPVHFPFIGRQAVFKMGQLNATECQVAGIFPGQCAA